MMSCNKQIRVQQLRASGAISFSSYGRFCRPPGSLEVRGGSQGRPLGVPGACPEGPRDPSQGAPGTSQGTPGSLSLDNSVI